MNHTHSVGVQVFETRLKVFLGFAGVLLLVIVGRLIQLQIVHADYYRGRAQRGLALRPKQIPFARGSILDRRGEVLAADEPCWDVNVDYRVIAASVGDVPGDPAGGGPAGAGIGREQIRHMWTDLANFATGSPAVDVGTLRDRGRRIYDRVTAIRRAVAARRGFDGPVAEERTAHVILPGLDGPRQIAARQAFRRYPWVSVEASTKRAYANDSTPFAHLLGRLGRVDAATVAADPNADDPFARYVADEPVGIAGVEYAAERMLRGRRGQLTLDRNGQRVGDLIEPQDGQDVTLSIHADLQRRLYRLLADRIREIPESPGGAIVVLEIGSREVLALVSYPAFDPGRFHELYPTLRDDTQSWPLRFRAVANRYAPGSIIKPLVCLAGLIGGRITPESRGECTGYLFPQHRSRWRCWQIHGTTQRKAHGLINVVEALRGSCNIFMYRLGERIGVDGLCSAFEMVGFGRSSGIGLKEETYGINPTAHWLIHEKNTPVNSAHARLFAIGQGELSVTPLQAANMMATLASGRYRPVALLRDQAHQPEWILPGTPSQWAAVRRGIYAVVNDPEGTAYQYAHFTHGRFALCGKTGSATAHAWPTAYRITYVDPDGSSAVAIIPAGARRQALRRFSAEHPGVTIDASEVSVHSRWPPERSKETDDAHAWFAGYLQALDDAGHPDWSSAPRIAFAVLVEFGGSGGRTAGPIAKAVAATLLEVFGPDLDVEAS